MLEIESSIKTTGLEIAVIGMAGQFPGAQNIKEFWENLKNGVESISFFTGEELKEAGVENDYLENPGYVKAGGFLEDRARFDALFFGYSPREAELMVPQMRIFHECAWSALEDASYTPWAFPGNIGFFCGASSSTTWEVLSQLSGKIDKLGTFAALTLADKDQLSTRISYNLNLRGPSLTIQTACSTGLVAIHLACQSLLSGDCEMALAGAATVFGINRQGYLYQEGGIYSPDGHCRSFDANANGSVASEGAGVVVLKSLEEAITDKDNIYAVIKGSAINNDGRAKVGYTSPSAKLQASVIYDALQIAEVDPGTIGYIETHGTGTNIGDPIEIEALKSVFGNGKKKSCRIGSVKTNLGHTITAAGIAGFIKAVLALKHRLIPPSLHFKIPNPKIGFENSPFEVNTELCPWKSNGHPLRGGVSSFGIGGTNMHMVLEEAPVTDDIKQMTDGRKYQIILLSAKTEAALEKMSENLVNHIKESPDINFSDMAYTLQVGREAFDYRKTITCSHVKQAVDALLSKDSRKVKTSASRGEERPVIFMFPGLGAQYVNMGYDLYKHEPVFCQEMDRCFEILKPLMGYDIKEIIYPDDSVSKVREVARVSGESTPVPTASPVAERINQFEIAQAVVFIFEYALAKLLIAWGIKPQAMIGYSFGEYAAACLSGVFSLEDALKLVTRRGQLIVKTPPGRMLSVPLPEQDLEPLLHGELSIAIDNGSSCIVAGEVSQIEAFENSLKEKKYICFPLQSEYAIHSHLMARVSSEFAAELRKIRLDQPLIPYISNLTGNWIKVEEATDPGYWSKHLEHTVQFSAGIKKIMEKPNAIFLEIGPGRDINALIQRYLEKNSPQQVVDLVRTSEQNISDVDYLWSKIGRLWLYGLDIDWKKLYGEKTRTRISLPTYPFAGEYFDMEKNISLRDRSWSGKEMLPEDYLREKKPDIRDWMYTPVWEQSYLINLQVKEPGIKRNWLVFIDEVGLGARLVKSLQEDAGEIIIVRAGKLFQKVSDLEFIINPASDRDYETLFSETRELKAIPDKILHMWCVDEEDNGIDLERYDKSQDPGFYCILNIVKTIGKLNILNAIEIEIITNNMHKITGEENFLCPAKATILGAVKVVPLEYSNIKCRSIDIVVPTGEEQRQRLVKSLESEFKREIQDIVTAYRGDCRWIQSMKPVPMDKAGDESLRLKEKGVYLITGGLGGMGLAFARYLGKSVKARLVLVGRKSIPGKEEWEKWISTHPKDDPVSLKIQQLLEIETLGGEVMVFSADVSDLEQMKSVITRAEERFGPINGIIHTAGVIDFAGVIHRRVKEDTEKVMAAKVKGTIVLEHIFKDASLDFLILFSSAITSFYQGSYGQIGYIGANDFLNVFTYYKKLQGRVLTITVNWADWQEVGMTVNAYMHRSAREGAEFGSRVLIDESAQNISGMMPREGVIAFSRVIDNNLPQVFISPYDLIGLLKSVNKHGFVTSGDETSGQKAKQPLSRLQHQLTSDYVAPGNQLERKIAEIWQDVFGFENIGIHDNFFEMGGDSLLAAVFAGRFKELFGEIVHVTVMFDAPTIAELAQYFNKHYPEAAAAVMGHEPKTNAFTSDERLTSVKIAEVRQLIPPLKPLKPLGTRDELKAAKNPSAVFILSPPRTGSTLLRVMLAGHPQLFAPPELNLLPFNTLQDRENIITDKTRALYEGPIRAIMQIKQCSAEKAHSYMRELLEKEMTIRQFYRLLQEWPGNRILVDKSPNYASNPGILERAEEYFENPLYINLIRHPYGMIHSYEEAKLDLVFGEITSDRYTFTRRELAELLWVISYQNIMGFFKNVPGERCYNIKFEDLVREPKRHVEDMCRFLGIDFHIGMLNPYEEEKHRMTDSIHPRGMMIGDVKFHRHQGINPEVADHWRKTYKVDFLGEETLKLARHFGYTTISGYNQEACGYNTIKAHTKKEELEKLLGEIDNLPEEHLDALLAQMES